MKPDSKESSDELLPLVYTELRQLAGARLAKLPKGLTLQATALVHEAYLRISEREGVGWQGRRHYMFAAARAMRDIVVEDARRKSASKRGGDLQRVTLMGLPEQSTSDFDDVLLLNDALDELKQEHPEAHELVMLRFFCGLSVEEAAELTEFSASTIKRKWRFSRAWLRKAMDS